MLAAKLCLTALKLLGRNASYLPGKIAITIDKDFIGGLTPPDTVIAVTGTNGKTTVSNLLNSILIENGYRVTNNSLGSNVQAGIANALLEDSTFTGKPTKEIAVLEVDERSSLRIYPYLKPDYLICNNIMRDSLARNAHTEFISYIINTALPATTKVILNADDLVCATLAPSNTQRVYFGLDVEKCHETGPIYLQDIVYCPQCGVKLEAEYLRYNHIGRMHCSHCDFASPAADFAITGIDREHGIFTVSHCGTEEDFTLINDNIVNLYNFAGVIALLTTMGFSIDKIKKGFERVEIVKTRFDKMQSGDLTITMQLSKGQNPTACARCFSYVSKRPENDKAIIFIGDNFEDSESPCWIYDSNYSYLQDPSINQIIFSGPRCKDQFLRAQIAGVPTDKIRMIEDSAAGPEILDTNASKNIYVLYGPYMVKEANIVKEKLVRMGMEAQNDGR
jgi:UDP-N-acetylmuramyl tripeptide synthase